MKIALNLGILLLCASRVLAQGAVPAPDAAAQNSAGLSPAAQGTPAAKIDPQKEADIRRLLEISGAKNNFNAMIANFSSLTRQNLEKRVPNEAGRQFAGLVVEKMQRKMNLQYDGLMETLLPVYDKYYSDEDIRGLLEFYGTPLGQKLLSALPNITREAQSIGYQWGYKIGEDSVKEVLQEHPEYPPSSEQK